MDEQLTRWLRCLALASLLAVPSGALADVVELTNGQRLVGAVTDARATGVVIRVGDRDMWIPQERVRSITFGDTTPRPAAPTSPPRTTTGTARPAPAPSAPAPAPAAPKASATTEAAAPVPKATTSETPARALRPIPTEIAAALAALDRLQAATARALAPAEYVARVGETRQEVERALSAAPDTADVEGALATALSYHAVAAQAETVYAERGDLASIRLGPASACQPLNDRIAREAAELRLNPESPGVVGLLVATGGAPLLRACAGEKIAEAEALARRPR